MGSAASKDRDYIELYKPSRPCQLSNGEPCDACTRILNLEVQISWEQQRIYDTNVSLNLDDMYKQHRQFRTEMNHIHNPTVLQVPPEIASYIFELCMPPNSFASSFDDFNLWKEPKDLMVLGAVCREWRQIAWSTPLLWTIILVRLDYPDLPWLLDFMPFAGLRRVALGPVRPMVNIINQCSDRWHHLDLDIPTSFISSFCGGPDGAPNLHSLRIRPIGLHDGVNPKFETLGTRPKPVNVYLMFHHIGRVCIDWSHVTRVNITSIDLDECIQLFKQAPQLTHCSLSRVSLGWESLSPPDPTVHLRLQELVFAYPTSDVSTFFNRFTFPALNALSFNIDNEFLPAAALVSFIQRSSCRLVELSIMNTKFSTHDLSLVLTQTPSLRVLDIAPCSSEIFSSRTIFTSLYNTSVSNPDERPAFLPELRMFIYHFGHVYSPTGERLLEEDEIPWDLIPSVYSPTSGTQQPRRPPLQKVEITFSRYTPDIPLVVIPKLWLPPLLGVIEAGLDLRIRFEGISTLQFTWLLQSSKKSRGERGNLARTAKSIRLRRISAFFLVNLTGLVELGFLLRLFVDLGPLRNFNLRSPTLPSFSDSFCLALDFLWDGKYFIGTIPIFPLIQANASVLNSLTITVPKILMASISSTSAPTPSSSPSSDVDGSIPDPTAPHISPPVAIVAGTLSGSIVILAAILVLILVRHQRSDDRRRRRESIMRMWRAQHSGPFVGKTIPSSIINALKTQTRHPVYDDSSFKFASKRSRWSSYRKKKLWRYKLRTTVRTLVRPGPRTRRSVFDASSQDTTPEHQHSAPLSIEQPSISTTPPPRSPLDIPPTLQGQAQPPSLLESPPAYDHVR
ncbi:hypothetical protein CPB84DRAFT_1749958 [Gymnopilus junonius]|uniref:F-box domain-containing protein n=1 Tax=Gymnopilus junonius TaxID=109634 RepID=A0A9P5TJW3_GYMJU|nr:hypothetical protein CPB84DRAFT_1749958 [Gymnopilus junonius]